MELEKNLRILCGSLPSRLSSAEHWEDGPGTSSSMSSGFTLEISKRNDRYYDDDSNMNAKSLKNDFIPVQSMNKFDIQNGESDSDNELHTNNENESKGRKIKLKDLERKKQNLQTPPENILLSETQREIG